MLAEEQIMLASFLKILGLVPVPFLSFHHFFEVAFLDAPGFLKRDQPQVEALHCRAIGQSFPSSLFR
jgi:hypothetical protein